MAAYSVPALEVLGGQLLWFGGEPFGFVLWETAAPLVSFLETVGGHYSIPVLFIRGRCHPYRRCPTIEELSLPHTCGDEHTMLKGLCLGALQNFFAEISAPVSDHYNPFYTQRGGAAAVEGACVMIIFYYYHTRPLPAPPL
ncbi:hypothetical protein GDO81_021849 [Engystomops pustulosus]|uniref:Uncharacterized protein n=1 Tax=Engystomops pustulosus TaxID=76066 RepID=A0AAV6ZP71_ENGPU|nr:hypothetical protein GDO81_021849 [Engystomops pustulosus]